MKRRYQFLITTAGLLISGAAMAQPTMEEIVGQLREQGYKRIEAERTWLGRVRIIADDGNRYREIVFNQRTGEILRDYWDELEDEADDPDERELDLDEEEQFHVDDENQGDNESQEDADHEDDEELDEEKAQDEDNEEDEDDDDDGV